jgi:hypothetical protein
VQAQLFNSISIDPAAQSVMSRRQGEPAFLVSDVLMVGTAGLVLVAAGLLQRSLGDIHEAEGRLPSAAGAKSRRESQRSKRFLKRNPKSSK